MSWFFCCKTFRQDHRINILGPLTYIPWKSNNFDKISKCLKNVDFFSWANFWSSPIFSWQFLYAVKCPFSRGHNMSWRHSHAPVYLKLQYIRLIRAFNRGRKTYIRSIQIFGVISTCLLSVLTENEYSGLKNYIITIQIGNLVRVDKFDLGKVEMEKILGVASPTNEIRKHWRSQM